jgi:hypothetical protein
MRSLLFTVIFASFLSESSAAQENQAPQQEAIACRVSPSKPGYFENDSLGVTVPDKFVFRPGGPGFVDTDGALGMKVGWSRKKKGHLQISGKRLDGPAPPARAYIYDYGDSGFQPIYLVFPTPGCWQITGEVADGRLSFVALVEKIGEGPSWQFEGLEPGWRASGGVTRPK